MKKTFHKGIALAISLALIVSVCLLGGTATASETPGYTVTTTFGATSTDVIDTNNLLFGITPWENVDVTRWTDGLTTCQPASMTRLSFPLESKTTINQIKVTSLNGSNSATSRLGSYDIYVADSYSELYKAENKVATFDTDTDALAYGTFTDIFEFNGDYAKTGKYIGFDVTRKNNGNLSQIFITEIQVFGTEHQGNYTVSTTAGTTGDSTEAAIAANIISGKESISYPGTNFAQLTNGKYAPISVGGASSAWPLKFSYSLDGAYDINKVIVTSESGAKRLAEYDIYVADTLTELFYDENRVASISKPRYNAYSSTTTTIDTIEFAENHEIKGHYIGFALVRPTTNASLEGAKIAEFEVQGVSLNLDYTLSTNTGSTGAASDESKAANIINGMESISYTAAHFAQLTNGDYSPISVGSATSAWPLKFTYQFDGQYDISKVIVTSNSGAKRLTEYEIYVSDVLDELYNKSNKVAVVSEGQFNTETSTTTTVDTIVFNENISIVGTYIGFKLIDPVVATAASGALISEFEVQGVEVVKDYKVTTKSGSKNDVFDASKNLIYSKKPQEMLDTIDIEYLTDGDSKNTRNLVSVTTISYDLGGLTTVEGIRVVSENNSGVANSRLGAYEIYIADTYEELSNPENKVAVVNPASTDSTACTYIDTITFSENYAKTGKWVRFNILERTIAVADGTAHLCELEVFGTKKASVTAAVGEGGTITPAGETALNGTPVEYTVTPDSGFKVDEVLVNGAKVPLTDGKYTFTGNEEGWNTIEVKFVLIGDVNKNGNFDDNDLLIIQKDILDIEKADINYADIDGDGDIDLLDLVTAYDLQQGISPAVASLETTLNLTHSEYVAAINRAAGFNTSATATDRLNAVFEKAQNGQPITIAAIGGSITEGAGCNVMSGVSVSAESLGVTVNGSDYLNSRYVDRVVNWFDTTFESSAVTKINAGIGGTPSFLGTFRLEHDVLSHNPDLVIVEFSVNDLGNYQLDEGYMLDAYESVIRKSLESGAAVVAVFTVNNLYDNIGNSWQNFHKLIAEHYNIPTISYHNAIYPDGEWITEWTNLSGDNVHPNVAGHALLANCITSYFEDVYAMDTNTATDIPDDWYHNDTFANTDIVYFNNAEFNGMTKVASNKYGCIATNKAGTGNESITVQIPAGAKEIYVFYNTIANAGSVYTKLGDNAKAGPYPTNVSSISYSHGEWTRIYNGEALKEDTTLTIRSANDEKPLEILTVLVLK